MEGNYIAWKRAKGNVLGGQVNLPYGSVLECRTLPGGTFLFYGETAVCAADCHFSHRHFAWNGDGQGLERGRLIHAIQARLEKRDSLYQDRWDRVWSDPVCQRFRRQDHKEYWLWNDRFFSARMEELRHIAEVVGA